MAFKLLPDKYRKTSFSERDKGRPFERLMRAYLLKDPEYSNKLKNVWLRNDFPGKNDLGGQDTGIDLFAFDYRQCKRAYYGNSGKTARIEFRITGRGMSPTCPYD